MQLDEAKHNFIQAWGSLGSSWGINKVMAQIHALLLISPKPLTTDDIMEELQISRGNANMNVRALIDWGIVFKVFVPGERKEFFKSEKDVHKLANQVAKERRKRELQPIMQMFQELENLEKGNSDEHKEFVKVTSDLESFAGKATGLLDKFVNSDSNWFFKVMKKIV